MDLSPLRNEITFGLNRIYLLFDKIGFCSSYYIATNRYVIEQFSQDMEKLPCPKFINWFSRDSIRSPDEVIFLRPGNTETFSRNLLLHGLWEGATVTFAAMQVAYFMGFSKVILIGVDHSFQTAGSPHQLIESQGRDSNHFHPDYFGKGVRWQLPDLETSERAYRLAQSAFESGGRKILDATVRGKLEVFEKIPYETLF